MQFDTKPAKLTTDFLAEPDVWIITTLRLQPTLCGDLELLNQCDNEAPHLGHKVPWVIHV